MPKDNFSHTLYNLKYTSFKKDKYIKVNTKFIISNFIALLWMIFSIILSIPWLKDLSNLITFPIALFVIGGLGYVPGCINMFVLTSLLLDSQPKFEKRKCINEVTIIIACHNEEKGILDTLAYIPKQDFNGSVKIIVVDNASTDNTFQIAKHEGTRLGLDILVIQEKKSGKHNALNTALKYVKTDYLITLDADTLLHKSALKYLISRMESSPPDVCAIAGTVLTRNSRYNFLTKLQQWDYFLGIASVKRLQGLYQGTLVAQGAFSLYETNAIKEINGWPDAIGEDIVLTWNLLNKNKKVFFEPLSVAFTDVPTSLKHLTRQRSRWARGMVEALKLIKPWKQPIMYVKYLTTINLLMPYLDISYTFFFIPGIILAFFGNYAIVGLLTLLVFPLALLQNYVLYKYQKNVFKSLNLKIRKNNLAFIVYIFGYQMIMSPMSLIGYFQEIFKLRRVWK